MKGDSKLDEFVTAYYILYQKPNQNPVDEHRSDVPIKSSIDENNWTYITNENGSPKVTY